MTLSGCSHLKQRLSGQDALARVVALIGQRRERSTVVEGPVQVALAILETRKLVWAILDAIEREHPEYERKHAEAIRAALSQLKSAPSMTADQRQALG